MTNQLQPINHSLRALHILNVTEHSSFETQNPSIKGYNGVSAQCSHKNTENNSVMIIC